MIFQNKELTFPSVASPGRVANSNKPADLPVGSRLEMSIVPIVNTLGGSTPETGIPKAT